MEGLTPCERDLAGTDHGAHARLAQGLRDIARFIETHRNLPIPSSVTIGYTIPAATDKDGEDEAYRIAQILGAKVDGVGGNARTELAFGPDVTYAADYLTRGFMAAYERHMEPWLQDRIIAIREGRRISPEPTAPAHTHASMSRVQVQMVRTGQGTATTAPAPKLREKRSA